MHSTATKNQQSPIVQPCIGLLVSISEEGVPLVSFAGNVGELPCACRVATALTPAALGRSVLLLPDPRDGHPVIVGVVQDFVEQPSVLTTSSTVTVSMDNDEELSFVATRRISLRCGKASITLDADGNVDIRGQYLLSRAARQNKIKGASISFN